MFSTTNCHLYHYAGNNPVRYVDPDGREFFPNLLKILSGTVKATVGGCGVVVFGSATIVLVADDCTGVGVLDDGLAALTAVGFLASCDYAFYGTQEIASGVFGIGCDISTAIQRKLSGFTFQIPSVSTLLENYRQANDYFLASKDNNNENSEKKEYKTPKPGSGKEKATDVPSWAKGNRPYKGENGKEFAKRLFDEHYGEGNWNTKDPDFSKIKKWGDRGFE